MRKFKDFDWAVVARYMGGAVTRSNALEAEISVGAAAYRLQDLRGQIVISKIEVIDPKVPYTDRTITDATLGYRLGRAIAGENIDYATDLDAGVEDEGGDDGEEQEG